MLELLARERSEIIAKFFEHLTLTVIAVGIGLLIAFPLAIYAYRHRWFYGPLTGASGLLYTIPSLALFAFLTPYTGLTMVSAEIGLVSYTLLILIRSIVGGLQNVPEEARESGRGMGLSSRQLLWQVELPLALPVIFAGVRLATVTVTGLVTVTSVITYGGLGAFILEGMRTFDTSLSVMGGIFSLLLAVMADSGLRRLEVVSTPWADRQAV